MQPVSQCQNGQTLPSSRPVAKRAERTMSEETNASKRQFRFNGYIARQPKSHAHWLLSRYARPSSPRGGSRDSFQLVWGRYLQFLTDRTCRHYCSSNEDNLLSTPSQFSEDVIGMRPSPVRRTYRYESGLFPKTVRVWEANYTRNTWCWSLCWS